MGKIIDITGQIFGNWTVLEKSDKKTSNHNVHWLCQCTCGMQSVVSGSDLRMGKSTKCRNCASIQNKYRRHSKNTGGYNEEYYKHEIGKQYGKLTVLGRSPLEEQTATATKMRCKCECGNIVDIRIDNLHSGRTKSCGCVRSYGENKIHQLLQSNNINYISEYSFDDLLGVNNGKLRFDFAIFNKDNQLIKLIEFQGRQHYEITQLWSNDNKIHDVYKREYCKNHNIELLEIKYNDIDKITLQFLGLDK